MDERQINERVADVFANGDGTVGSTQAAQSGEDSLAPQACPTCGTTAVNPAGGPAPSYVFAVGKIEFRFPGPSVVADCCFL